VWYYTLDSLFFVRLGYFTAIVIYEILSFHSRCKEEKERESFLFIYLKKTKYGRVYFQNWFMVFGVMQVGTQYL
jgi:hypothetical protein